MVSVMSHSLTCPHGVLLGVDNVRINLNVPVPGENSKASYRVWLIPQQVSFFTVIERWFQQNIPPKNSSATFYQKGSLMAEFDPIS